MKVKELRELLCHTFFSSQTYFLNLLTNFRNLTFCWSADKENVYTNLKRVEPYEFVYSSREIAAFCLLANSVSYYNLEVRPLETNSTRFTTGTNTPILGSFLSYIDRDFRFKNYVGHSWMKRLSSVLIEAMLRFSLGICFRTKFYTFSDDISCTDRASLGVKFLRHNVARHCTHLNANIKINTHGNSKLFTWPTSKDVVLREYTLALILEIIFASTSLCVRA